MRGRTQRVELPAGGCRKNKEEIQEVVMEDRNLAGLSKEDAVDRVR